MNNDSRIIMITGCAGFIGSHLVDHFIQKGTKVIGIDNFCPQYDRNIKEGNLAKHTTTENDLFTLIEADISESTTLEQITQHLDGGKVSAIIHSARARRLDLPAQDSEAEFRINVIATRKLLEIAKDIGNPQLIFASTDAIYEHAATDGDCRESSKISDPDDSFALTKLMGEQIGRIYAQNFGSKFTALRFASVYGPRLRPDLPLYSYLESVAENGSLPDCADNKACTHTTNFIYINDLVQGVDRALEHIGQSFEIINLASSEQNCLHVFLETMSKTFGVRDNSLNALDTQNPDASQKNAPPLDLTKARELLNFEAETNFETGIRNLAEWFFNQNQQSSQSE